MKSTFDILMIFVDIFIVALTIVAYFCFVTIPALY